jgi:uncharacterized protein (DUF3084 family)
MSSIGRIFVVVNLALSAAFVGWAGAILAKSDQFKKKYDEEVSHHKETERSLTAKNAAITSERDETKQSLSTLRDEKNRLDADADRLEKQLATAKQENTQLRSSVDAINGKLGDFQQNLKADQDRIAELDREKEKLRTEKEAAVTAQMSATTEKENAVEEARRLKDSVASLQKDVTSLTEERDKVKLQRDQIVALTGVSLDKVLAQPFIQAHVVEVLSDAGLVALNVGSDDGVTRGFSFDVFRGSSYKGKVVVESVDKKICSARIALRNGNQSIEKGDRAATRLP